MRILSLHPAVGTFLLGISISLVVGSFLVASPFPGEMTAMSASGSDFVSVEVGVADLSPNGVEGGYAVPASGCATGALCGARACTLSLDANPITLGNDTTLNVTVVPGVTLVSVVETGALTTNLGTGLTHTVPVGASPTIDDVYGYEATVSNTYTWFDTNNKQDVTETEYYTCAATLNTPRALVVDLTPTIILLESGNLEQGDTVSFRGRHRNNGPDQVGSGYTNRFYWRYVGESTFGLNRIDRSIGLSPGFYVDQFSDSFVIDQNKDIQVGFRVDVDNTIDETNESNLLWTTFTLNPEVDIEPTDITLEYGNLSQGEIVYFRGFHTNNGPDTLAQPFTNRMFWRYLGEGAGDWIQIGDTEFTLPLAPGDIGSRFFDPILIPVGDTRDIQVAYRTDISNDVDETNEVNNLLVRTFVIDPDVDLNPTDITLESGTVGQGNPLVFRGHHINNGPDDILPDYNGRFLWRFVGDTAWITLDDLVLNSGGLLNGNVATQLSSTLTPGEDRDIQIAYRTDPDSQIVETNEVNNVIIRTFTVGTDCCSSSGPAPTVDIEANGDDGPITVNQGDSVNLTWTSSNADSCTGDTDFSTGGALNNTSPGVNDVVNATTTYQITCTNTDGTDQDSVVVRVDSGGGSPGGGAAPSITADEVIIRIDTDTDPDVTISWDTGGTASCTLTGGSLPAAANTTDGSTTGIDGTNGEDIDSQTRFTIDCGVAGSDSVTVQVLPDVLET